MLKTMKRSEMPPRIRLPLKSWHLKKSRLLIRTEVLVVGLTNAKLRHRDRRISKGNPVKGSIQMR
jgi:hypothetical protein